MGTGNRLIREVHNEEKSSHNGQNNICAADSPLGCGACLYGILDPLLFRTVPKGDSSPRGILAALKAGAIHLCFDSCLSDSGKLWSVRNLLKDKEKERTMTLKPLKELA